MQRIISTTLLLFLFLNLWAQQGHEQIKGQVTEKTEAGEVYPLVGASIYWLGTTKGTTTDAEGNFRLKKINATNKLVVSYVGYQNDTLDISGKDFVDVRMEASIALNEVVVEHRRKAMEISRIDPIKTENIGEKEFLKAACCNLSESFETNPSVDVSFTDAVTGTRQIQMLGLAGPYTQLTRENMPGIRGLSAIYGLTYIPGPWVQSIQLNKGTGSVVNGYEGIAGQINTELRKPENAERFYLNLFANEGGRLEANANFAHRFKNNNWSTALLLHGKNNSVKWDRNNDSFLDHPLGTSLIGLNRWKYSGDGNWRIQFGVKATVVDNTGGQVGFDPATDALTTNSWGMQLNTHRYEGWAKAGKVFPELPWKSLAVQVSAASHNQDSYYGLNRYDANHESGYFNFIYQDILSNVRHKFKTGASLQYDNYQEQLNDTAFNFTEVVPGGYFEYTYLPSDDFTVVIGLRADYHNLYGAFFTPRVHLRYAITDKTILRASGGRGQKTASILAENSGLLASSRQIIIQGNTEDKPYGLNPEVAWNYGLNLTRHFRLNYREGALSFDYYRTDFQNQIIVDLEQSPQWAVFYNLEGKSFANSFQAQLDYELIRLLDVRLAYRWYDVNTTYNGELQQKPLLAAHRAFVNVAYETGNGWKFDYTVNWQGEKRIPYTNPEEFQLKQYSPDFLIMNTQVTKAWERVEVYVGMENITGYKQGNPIISSNDPFSDYFDSSMIWGPVFGRKTYVGLRLRID